MHATCFWLKSASCKLFWRIRKKITSGDRHSQNVKECHQNLEHSIITHDILLDPVGNSPLKPPAMMTMAIVRRLSAVKMLFINVDSLTPTASNTAGKKPSIGRFRTAPDKLLNHLPAASPRRRRKNRGTWIGSPPPTWAICWETRRASCSLSARRCSCSCRGPRLPFLCANNRIK